MKKKLSKFSIIIGVLLLATVMMSSTLILSVSAPARRTECIGKGIYRIREFSYTEQTDWQPVYGGVAEIDIKVTSTVHPKFGYGELEWIINDASEGNNKILTSVSIDEPVFYPFSPILPLRVDFGGEADFIWGEARVGTHFEATVVDGDPVDQPDHFSIQIGEGEPVLIGEIRSYNFRKDVFIPSYDTIVFRDNTVVVGGATSFEVGKDSFPVSSGECIVITEENLVVDGVASGPNVFYLDGKGGDLWITGLDGKGTDNLKINGMEPIIIDGGDTIVADGGYTVIRGANGMHDSAGDDQFTRGNIIIKNPPIE
jgi:hypothetical protein